MQYFRHYGVSLHIISLKMHYISYGKSELPVYVVVSSDLPYKMSISALGIHYLHSEAPVKVIHRDLKSRNGNRFDILRHFYVSKTWSNIFLKVNTYFLFQLFWQQKKFSR